MKQVLMIGVSHQTAPVEVRERLAFTPEQAAAGTAALRSEGVLGEAVILSTCNRSEVYGVAEATGNARERLCSWYTEFHGLRREALDECLCARQDREAVRHLFRVASGLDSMLLGEAEILGQVREAYKVAVEHSATGPVLNRLFQGALEVGKRVRTQTDLGARPMSVAFAGVKLAERVFGKAKGKQALVLGAGTVAEQVVDHLRNRGIGLLLVSNRSAERGQELARRFGGEAVPWAELENALARPEIVICSVGGESVLTCSMIQRAMATRGNRALFLIDLGVPRNVQASAAKLYNVYLYNLDDLTEIVEQNKRARQEEIPRAETIVAEHVAKFQMWFSGVQVVALIGQLREKVRHERERILREHLDQLTDLSPEDRRRAARQLEALVDRMLRQPAERWEESSVLRSEAPELRAVREILRAGEKP